MARKIRPPITLKATAFSILFVAAEFWVLLGRMIGVAGTVTVRIWARLVLVYGDGRRKLEVGNM